MAAKFKDLHAAARMRDVMRKIALDQINKVLPADEFGIVIAVDTVSHHATIQLPDGSLPTTVAYGFGVAPTIGDAVRITGRSGSRYIAGLIGGSTGAVDIAALTTAAALTGGELLEVVQGGAVYSTSTHDIAALAVSSPSITHYTICTAATRPTTPSPGDTIYETDTGNTLVFQSTIGAWTPPWNTSWGILNAAGSLTNETPITSTHTDVLGPLDFFALKSRAYEHTIKVLVSNNTNDGDVVIQLVDGSNNELSHGVIRVPQAGDFITLSYTTFEFGNFIGNATVERKLRAFSAVGTGALQNATVEFEWTIKDIGNGPPNGGPPA